MTTPAPSHVAGRPQSGTIPLRAVLLVPAALALLAGLDAALMLLDVPAPLTADRLPQAHGMLMVLGFLGTLIALERAVAAGHRAALAAPALLGLGGLLLVSAAPPAVGRWVLVAGTAGLLAVYWPLWRRQHDDAVLVQALGAALALGAAVLWTGGVPMPAVLPWLAGFVVLTIAGERLELARIGMGASAGPTLVLLASAFLVAVVAALLWPAVGTPALGATVVILTAWLARHDVARHTVRGTGLPRYVASCLLAAYVWLAVAGATWLLGGPATEGARYDAVAHAVFLGFAITMVMAHAPVILPAVLRRPLPYHRVLYVPVAVLHGGLVTRVWVGDALGHRDVWVAGGVVTVLALVGFAVAAAWSAIRPAARAQAEVTR